MVGFVLAAAQVPCDARSQQPMNLNAFTTAASDYSSLLSQPPAASRFLMCLRQRNPGLAETLMLFQRRLEHAADVEAAFLHYVINSRREPSLGDEDPETLRRLELRYREALVLPAGTGPAAGQSATLSALRDFGHEANRSRYGRDDVVPTGLLDFQEAPVGYSRLNAVWMAEMSALAYWDGELVERQLRQWGYKLVAVIADEGTDTFAFLAEKDEHTVLAFRGTSSLKNFSTDAQGWKTQATWAKGNLHSGFVRALEAVWPRLVERLGAPEKHPKKLWVTGHSLGAALAELAALRLTKLHYDVRAVYTFGKPRVGDAGFVSDYDSLLGNQTFPHINRTDVVTRVPPASLGFRTSARAQILQFTGGGHTLRRLEATTEEASVWRDVMASIRRTTDFLPAPLRPASLRPTARVEAPPMFYANDDFKEGPLDEHGSFQYLFKLACVALEQDLWPQEVRQASLPLQ